MFPKIPPASEYIYGLMSPDSFRRLRALSSGTAADFSNISGTSLVYQSGTFSGILSATIGRFHQLSASYFSASSGGVNNFSATRLTVTDLVVLNSNLTATAVIPNVLSGTDFLATTGTFINGSITFLSSSDIKTHQLSSSWFTATRATIQSASLGVLTSSRLDITTQFNSLFSSSLSNLFQLSSSYLSASSGGINNFSSSKITVTDLIVINTNITASIPNVLSGTDFLATTATFINGNILFLSSSDIKTHQLSSSWFTSTRNTLFSASISNLTASIGNVGTLFGTLVSSTIGQLFQLTASHVTSSFITSTYITSTHSYNHFFTSAYSRIINLLSQDINATYITATVGISSSFITSTVGQIFNFTNSFSTSSQGRYHFLTSSYLRSINFVASNIEANLITATSGINTAVLSATTSTFHIVTSSYSSSSYGQFHQLSSSYLRGINTLFDTVIVNLMTATYSSASFSQNHSLTASYLRGINFLASNIETNLITATSGAYINSLSGSVATITTVTSTYSSASFSQNHQLTASYLRGINVVASNIEANLITATSGIYSPFITSSIYIGNILTSSFITSSDGKFNTFTSSYGRIINGVASSFDVVNLTALYTNITSSIPDPLSSSILRAHMLSASYFEFNTGTFIGQVQAKGGIKLDNQYGISGSGDAAFKIVTVGDLSGSDGKFYTFSASFFTASQFLVHTATALNANTINNFRVGGDLTVGQTSQFNNNMGILGDTYWNGTFKGGSTPFVKSNGDAQFETAEIQYIDYASSSGNILTATHFTSSNISGTFITGSRIDGLNIFGSLFSSSIAQSHRVSGSYQTSTQILSNYITASYFTGNFGLYNQLSSTHFSATNGNIQNQNLNFVNNISPVRLKITDSQFSATASTTQILPILTQSVAANEWWQFSVNLNSVMTGTGGYRLTVFAPTGSLLNGWLDGRTTAAATTTQGPLLLTNLNSEIAVTLNGVTLTPLKQNLEFTLRNGSNAGTVAIGVRRVTATDTLLIYTGSYLQSVKVIKES